MTQIEWAMWANEQALASSFVLLVGSAVCVSGMFSSWQFGIYGIIASLLVLIVEWPRSKRKKGNTMERHFQRPFTIFVNKLGIAGRNYFVRFAAYLLLCIPCCFTLATLLGGICYIVTGAIYFLAAMKGEEWSASGLEKVDKSNQKRVKSLHPPKKPPPRVTQDDSGIAEVGTDNITMEIEEETPRRPQPVTRSRPPPPSSESRDASAVTPAARPTRPPPRPQAPARETIQETSNS